MWQRFGKVTTYIEPFCFSAAVLWARPGPFKGREILNDANGYVSNFWRAMRADPEAVAYHCDYPVNETDLHARHVWLITAGADLIARCYDDPDFYDARVAGWWAWGLSCWIGAGWCDVPMTRENKKPHIGSADSFADTMGVYAIAAAPDQKTPQIVPRGDVDYGAGVHAIANRVPQGIARLSRQPGTGVHGPMSQSFDNLLAAFKHLQARLRHVKVCCGDWKRVVTKGVVGKDKRKGSETAIFLDPPYSAKAGRMAKIYAVDYLEVGQEVAAWAFARPYLKIALCGYEGEYDVPSDWETLEWKAQGGYANQGKDADGQGKKNRFKERIWFSPACERAKQGSLL